MTINWWTIALQAINFLVLLWLLRRLLYKPALAVIAKRKALVEQAFAEAEEAKEAAAAEQRRYEEVQAQLVQSRQEYLGKAHAEIEADKAKVLQDATAQAADIVEDARRQLAAEREAALADTRIQVADLAVEMATELLQQVTHQAGPACRFNVTFLEQVLNRLDALADDERRALRQDLDTDGEGLRIVTATPLAKSEQEERWKQALEHRIGPLGNLEFINEADLLGGAELRFPHAVLSLAWSEFLRRGREALLADEIDH